MSNVIVDKSKIDVLANAISNKSGEPVTTTLDEMVEAVDGIEMNPTLQNKSVVYDNPGPNTLKDTVVADGGYDGLGKVDISVTGAAGATTSLTHSKGYLTESGVRKWEFRPILKVTKSGWVPQGTTNGQYIQFSAIGTGSVITPSKTAQTIGGANYMMEGPVTVSAVPMADAGPAWGAETFITESGVRKFRYEYEAYAESEGWVDEGGLGDPTWVEWTAVPSNTTVTPTESAQTVGGTKYMMEGPVTVSAIPSNYVGSGVTQRSSTDLTASGATVTAPAGYYESGATKTVASGTEGTPTATKGTVSNNSVTVTPSVTNAAGYIPGGTHTGTAVTVTASELVSGTLNVTSSGTKDVTNYASASIPAGTEGTPTATKGTVSNNSVTVTPSVTNTAGYVSGGTHTGTAVTVSASELVSGSQTITTNGTVDVTNLEEVVVSVSGGGARTAIIPEQTITSSSQYTYFQTFNTPIIVGETYIITVNGTEYTGTAYLDGNPCLRVPGTTSGEIVYANGNMLYYAGSSSDYGTYIIKVEQEISGGGIIREPIVPQTTVTGVVGDWVRLTSGSTPSIVDGEFYSYTINGTEYLATGTTNNGIVYLSDILWDWSISGEAIGYDIQYGGIWLSASTAGSYTVKVDKITLANSGLKTQVIFPEQTVTATTTEQSGYSANISVSENITDGANYIVTMDGTPYLCYGKQLYGNNDVYCGDDTVIWGTPANARYPFMVATLGNGVTAWGVANNTAHTVKIEKVLSFDSAELGTKTITANGTYTASTDDFDGYSEVTVNVQSGGGTGYILSNIAPQQTVACTTLLMNNAYYGFLQNGTPIDASKKYFVTFDGTEYICEGYVPEANCTGIGDIRVTLSNAAQYLIEPFFIEYENATSDYYFVVRGSGTHTIKIDEIIVGDEVGNLQAKIATPTTSQQTITPDNGYDGLSQVTVNAIPSQYVVPTGNKAITANGTNIDVAQYATVSVNVSGSSVNVGTVTTTNSSNQNTSISFTLPSGRTPKAFFCRLTSQIARNSNSRYYYCYDMRWDGSSTGGVAGNTFYMSSGTLTNVTSGYSYSQSNTTFTLSSTGTRSTSPGSFYNGTYELVYVY